MGTEGICILLLKDDLTCKNIVDEMLLHCNYEVLHIGGALDVLNMLWEAKDGFELVLTNAHKFESNGIEIVQYIEKKFNLPIILMSPDRMKIESKGQPCNFAAYVLNGLSTNAVKKLWQFAFEKEKAKKMAANEQEKGTINNDKNIAVVADRAPSSSILEAEGSNRKSKRKLRAGMKNKDGRENSPMRKKQRVVWTSEMHQKFLEAIETLGYDKAVPKKIVEVMSIPGITRENVASHLQKFRGGLKRNQETASLNSHLSGRNRTDELKRSSFLSSSKLNSLSMASCCNNSVMHQIPSIPNTKQSYFLLKPNYLSTQDMFSDERDHYTNLGIHQKYVPGLQLSRNFRIYGDETKNVLLTVNQGTSSSGRERSTGSKFVGYRLTSDGNSIASASGFQFTSHVQKNPILDQNPPNSTEFASQGTFLFGNALVESSFQCPSVSGFQENEDQAQCMEFPSQEQPLSSLNSNFQHQFLMQSFEASENGNKDPCSIFSFPFQETHQQSVGTPSNQAAAQIPSENEIRIPILSVSHQEQQQVLIQPISGNSRDDESSSVFLSDQEFSLPEIETTGNDMTGKKSSMLFEEEDSQILICPSSPQLQQMMQELNKCLDKDGNGIDEVVVMSGSGSSVQQFDWEELDDETLFNNNDD